MKPINAARELMNLYGKEKTPFLFILDFDLQHPMILRTDELRSDKILYDIQQTTNSPHSSGDHKELEFKKHPVPYESYKTAFDQVIFHLCEGNTYLLNLTFPTRIETNYSLEEIYFSSTAKCKLLVKDSFVVFSPELFVQIEDRRISSFPMKGTIDASLPGAEGRIISDEKEMAEHATIVDLIRNDLSIVAKNVVVEKFRYIEQIQTNEKPLLQVSSKITGRLESNYHERIGDIIVPLLPAGSVTGAPKKKTVEIIHAVEPTERGYYTGVFGLFDGERLESGVMIRFIEQRDGIFHYKSGGGITALSNADSEYREMIEKVYVPVA
ncbi:MAG: aminodeoxychorismate synthase component I [Ignavibacteriae bacterium]|nr:MAG: aminodeoxychorismate synthase component I [Ignavibacteriota bacterium]